MRYPGLLQDYRRYNVRDIYSIRNVRVVSMVALEDIRPGVLVQANGTRVQVAQTLNNIVGVCVYDPSMHSKDVVYQAGDVIPVCRRGAVYVRYTGERDPNPSEAARVVLGTGFFTTLTEGAAMSRAVFSTPSEEWYPFLGNLDFEVIPFPGTTETTFGNGDIALLELN